MANRRNDIFSIVVSGGMVVPTSNGARGTRIHPGVVREA